MFRIPVVIECVSDELVIAPLAALCVMLPFRAVQSMLAFCATRDNPCPALWLIFSVAESAWLPEEVCIVV